MRWMLLLCLFLAAGCLTPSGRQATGDPPVVLKAVYEKGAPPGDAKVKAAGREAEGVRRQVGGPKLAAPRSAEAMDATADAMEAEEAAWSSVTGWLAGLLPSIPYIGGGLAAALAAWKALRASRLAAAATTGVLAINRFKHMLERVKDALGKPDEATDWDAMGRDATILLDELKRAGQEGSAAWKELSAIHDGLKSRAKGPVLDPTG